MLCRLRRHTAMSRLSRCIRKPTKTTEAQNRSILSGGRDHAARGLAAARAPPSSAQYAETELRPGPTGLGLRGPALRGKSEGTDTTSRKKGQDPSAPKRVWYDI